MHKLAFCLSDTFIFMVWYITTFDHLSHSRQPYSYVASQLNWVTLIRDGIHLTMCQSCACCRIRLKSFNVTLPHCIAVFGELFSV